MKKIVKNFQKMVKNNWHCRILFASNLLLFLAATCESTHSIGKSKADEMALPSSSASAQDQVQTEKKLLKEECFADFLVFQFGEKTKMKKKTFVLDLQSISIAVKLREFMLGNSKKTEELWNCVNNVQPFAQNERISNNDGSERGSKLVDELTDIFRMEITRMYSIAPSQRAQEKLHNAQCLLDLGVIEGKILTKNGAIFSNGNDTDNKEDEQEWFQELSTDNKHPHIAISTEGADHLKKCLHKNKPFDVTIVNEQNKHLLLLNSVDRKALLQIVAKPLVPFSAWLLQKIGLSESQKQCFADFFVSHFGAVTKMNDRWQFTVESINFPPRHSVAGLMEAEESKKPFADCLKETSSFQNYLRNPMQMKNLVHEFYDKTAFEPGNSSLIEYIPQQIVLSKEMQQKMHNVQCWLDLGALEGKVKMDDPTPLGNGNNGNNRFASAGGTERWLEELELVHVVQLPILTSPEGADHLGQCLRKGAPFEAKLEKSTKENKWHVQLLDNRNRTGANNKLNELIRSIKQTPFSEWLFTEIFHERECVADFLVKHWHAQTSLMHFFIDLDSPNLWRKVEWSANDEHQSRWPRKVYADVKGFGTLKSCLIRKTIFLKFDTALGKQYIDLDLLFQQAGGFVYTTQSLAKELNTQSDCLAKFLAIKSEGKCLLKKRNGPTGQPLYMYFMDPFLAVFKEYTFKSGPTDSNSVLYSLSAEKCNLPEGETGIYRERSENSKEREDFKLLWDCGVRMTMEQEEGEGKAIDVRTLLRIHTPEQLYLRGIPMEIFFSPAEPTLDQGDVCPICREEYAQIGSIVVSIKRCKHHFHSHCIQDWMRGGYDSCPLCNGSITKIPQDPNGTFDVMIGGWLD